MLLLDAFRPLESVMAASYLTSGGGAEAVVGVLLYLLLLPDAFSATGGRRGGVLLYLLLLPDAFSATGGRRGGVLLYLMLLLDAFRPLESVMAASYLTSGGGAEAVIGVLLYLLLLLDAFTATEGCRGGGAHAVVAAAHMPSWRRPTLSPAAT